MNNKIAESPIFNSKEIRKIILKMAHDGSSVHIGCAFSIVEILAILYGKYLKYPMNDPEHFERDFLILSKGHGVMAQYACIFKLGWLCEDELHNYFHNGTKLMGLSDSRIPGIEVTSGSLGHGFSVGVGIAYGLQRLKSEQRVFAVVGDGEINEGPIWEGALFAAHHGLKNFMVIVDENGYQAMGKTSDIINLGSIKNKFESFGFEVESVDGHNEFDIDFGIQKLITSSSNAPKALIAKTTKGKGVSFMEGNNAWHYTRLNDEVYNLAIKELDRNE